MALSFFCEKAVKPSEQQVAEILGEISIYWDSVKQCISEYGEVKEEWKIYSQKAGWCKKIFLISDKEERNIIFIYPNIGYMTCVLVYGEKAAELAKHSELPKDIIRNIMLSKVYKEGRSFQLEIKTPQDFIVLKRLIDIKIQSS